LRTETITYLTETEEEFVKLFIAIGFKETVAKVLVFLAHVPTASSREIERGSGLRQPEVSIAMQQLLQRKWVTFRDTREKAIGRPLRSYCLSKSIHAILDCIEREKKTEVREHLRQVSNLRNYIP
jgi:predicted transcriptional regulator